MRSSVMPILTLVLALAPAAAYAQPPGGQPPSGQQPPAGQPPTSQQPPAGQPPAGQQPAQPAATAAPKVGFTGPAGMLLVQVGCPAAKPGAPPANPPCNVDEQARTFEEMMGKIMSGIPNSSDPQVKAQAGSWKYYKAAELAGGNIMYVVIIDPAAPNTEYQFLEVLNKTLTDDQKRDPATQDMYKRYAATIQLMNKLNLTPMGK